MRSRLFLAWTLGAWLAAAVLAGEAAAEEPFAASRLRPRLLSSAALRNAQANVQGDLGWMYRDRVRKDCEAPLDEKRLQFTLSNPNYLIARTLSLLIASRLEPERYREKALKLARAIAADSKGKTRRDARMRLQALSLLFDGLHDGLSGKERSELRKALLEAFRREAGAGDYKDTSFVSGHGHFTTASVVLAGLALCDGSGEIERELARVLEHWGKFVDVARHVAADGGHHLGWRYGRSYAARLAWTTEAMTSALQKDLFARERPWLSQLGYHLVYGLRPDFTYLRVGDTHRAIHVNLEEDVVLLGILSMRYRDGRLAWLAREIVEFLHRNRSIVPDASFAYPLLFIDPALKPEKPAALPLSRAFVRAGNYVMRTGWDADDTVILFRAMPWYHFNHEHRDFGSFLIYRQGGLAIDGGVYMGGSDESLYGGPHLRNYAWRTVAHNTITVFDPNERFCSPTGKGHERCEGDNRWANDGGQKIRSRTNDDVPVPSFQPQSASDIQDPRFAQGSVTSYEDTADFTAITADGTKAYRSDKVKLFERRFVYLKHAAGWNGPVVVVFDRVIAAQASFKKSWLLHVVEEPRRDGSAFVITNGTRVRFSGQEAVRPNDYWHQYSGKLHLEPLLPEEPQMEFVGGKGNEFWVDGVNHPAEVRDMDRIIEPGIGRIEVSPSRPSAEDFFLHVLAPASLADETPRPAARRLEASGAAAARVADWVLVFAGLKPGSEEASWDLGESSKDAPSRHLVLGLTPSRSYSIKWGARVEVKRASPQGILSWTGAATGRVGLNRV